MALATERTVNDSQKFYTTVLGETEKAKVYEIPLPTSYRYISEARQLDMIRYLHFDWVFDKYRELIKTNPELEVKPGQKMKVRDADDLHGKFLEWYVEKRQAEGKTTAISIKDIKEIKNGDYRRLQLKEHAHHHKLEAGYGGLYKKMRDGINGKQYLTSDQFKEIKRLATNVQYDKIHEIMILPLLQLQYDTRDPKKAKLWFEPITPYVNPRKNEKLAEPKPDASPNKTRFATQPALQQKIRQGLLTDDYPVPDAVELTGIGLSQLFDEKNPFRNANIYPNFSYWFRREMPDVAARSGFTRKAVDYVSYPEWFDREMPDASLRRSQLIRKNPEYVSSPEWFEREMPDIVHRIMRMNHPVTISTRGTVRARGGGSSTSVSWRYEIDAPVNEALKDVDITKFPPWMFEGKLPGLSGIEWIRKGKPEHLITILNDGTVRVKWGASGTENSWILGEGAPETKPRKRGKLLRGSNGGGVGF